VSGRSVRAAWGFLATHQITLSGILIGVAGTYLTRRGAICDGKDAVTYVSQIVGVVLILVDQGIQSLTRRVQEALEIRTVNDMVLRCKRIENPLVRELASARVDAAGRTIDDALQGRYRFEGEIEALSWLIAHFSDVRRLRAACSEKSWHVTWLMRRYFEAWFSAATAGCDTLRVFVLEERPSPGADEWIREHEARGVPIRRCTYADLDPYFVQMIEQELADALGHVPPTQPGNAFGFVLSQEWVVVHWGKGDSFTGFLLTGRAAECFQRIFAHFEKLPEIDSRPRSAG